MDILDGIRDIFSARKGGVADRPQARWSKKQAAKRHLVEVALRDTLAQFAIPTAWVGAQTLRSRPEASDSPMHVRLVIRHFESAVLLQSLTLERSFIKRLAVFDPAFKRWLASIAWQFALVEEPKAVVEKGADSSRRARRQPKLEPTEQEKLEELNRLFARSDVDRSIAASRSSANSDFADTQPFGESQALSS